MNKRKFDRMNYLIERDMDGHKSNLILIDLRVGDKVKINGISGHIRGLNGAPGKVTFIDLEPAK